jgi:hypothetical protein
MLVIVMLTPLSNEFQSEGIYNFDGARKKEMSSAIGIEKKAVTITMSANEDAHNERGWFNEAPKQDKNTETTR